MHILTAAGFDVVGQAGTPDAVEKHIRSIFQKLEIRTEAEDHRRVLAVLAFLQTQQP